MALISQAIIDEGAIGADGTINVTYTSKKNAEYLWRIANSWDLVHPLRIKKYSNHTKWCISFRAEKRSEIYHSTGRFPDHRQDRMFQHILRNYTGGRHKGKRGETQNKILQLLKKREMTVRSLGYHLDLSASTVRSHLRNLKQKNLVCIIGNNKNSIYKNQRTAKIWAYSNS